jgi:phage terminase small subunit
MTTKQKKFEKEQVSRGLKRCPIWIPEDREAEVRLAVEKMIENDDLTLTTLRSVKTGRWVSIEK